MNSALETFVPLQFKRKKGKLLVDGREGGHDVRIVEAVARAMHWHALLDTGAFKSVVEIAKAEGLMPTTVGRLLRLARLAPEIIERSLTGRLVTSADGVERCVPGFIRFHDGAAGFPWRSQAAWIGARLAGRHGLDPADAQKTAAAVFRSDLYRLHLAPAGADLPAASVKLEGSLDRPAPVASSRGRLILPADRFFDARIFDPDLPAC